MVGKILEQSELVLLALLSSAQLDDTRHTTLQQVEEDENWKDEAAAANNTIGRWCGAIGRTPTSGRIVSRDSPFLCISHIIIYSSICHGAKKFSRRKRQLQRLGGARCKLEEGRPHQARIIINRVRKHTES